MNAITLSDGRRVFELPLDGPRPVDLDRAVQGLASRTLERITQVGQEPAPGVNLAPVMRAVREEITRRKANETYLLQAQETATQVHLQRRWLQPAITNYGRTG